MISGKRANRDFRSEQVTVPPNKGWPMEPCIGSGVNAVQADELRGFFDKHGETVEVTGDGDPVYENTNQRKRCLRMRGFADNS